MRLQAKILALISPFVVLPLLGLGGAAFYQLRTGATDEAVHRLDLAVRQAAEQLDSRLAVDRANTLLFSGLGQVERYVLTASERDRYELLQPSLLALFARYQRVYPDYYEIRLLAPDGYEDTRSVLSPIPNATDEEGDTAWFRDIAASPNDVETRILRNPDNGEPALVISRRIALRDRSVDPLTVEPELRGYLVITSRLRHLEEIANGQHLPNRGQVFFTDASGKPWYEIPASGHDDVPRYGERITDIAFDEITDRPADGGIFSVRHLGDSYLLRGARLHENLDVFAGIPESELWQSIRDLGQTVAIVTLAAVLITGGLLYSALRRLLLAPLAKLRLAARAIGRGDLVTDLDIRREDEIGELAASFEEMGRSLSESNERIRYLAYHDSLTGLPNRRMFIDYLRRAVAHAVRREQQLGVLFLDIDDFKRINDSLGHDAGDDLLRALAERLSEVVRGYDYVARNDSRADDDGSPFEARNTVARIGGDEFIVLLPDLASPLDCAGVARRLMEKITAPVELAGRTWHVSTSIGVTTFPADGEDPEQLIKNADIALYHAKDLGKNAYQFYTDSMNVAAMRRMETETALRGALENDEFVLYYQPKVGARSGAVVGLEALIRWVSPTRGLVPPGDFIPVAEETGLIEPIGAWVLAEACRQIAAWRRAGIAPVSVSVNISNRQFRREGFFDVVSEAIRGAGVPSALLEIELTETSIMDAGEAAFATLDRLKALGIEISMDDFGTGYSSLGSLKRLPIDTLKIDRTFVRDITTDRDDATIVATILAMSRTLQLKTVAEGVETAEQLALLRDQGCDVIQGFLVSPPVSAAEVEVFLRPVRVANA